MSSSSRIFKKFTNDIIFTKKTQRGTEDTKLDVDDASLCVLCVLFFSFVIKKCRFGSLSEKFGMTHVCAHFSIVILVNLR